VSADCGNWTPTHVANSPLFLLVSLGSVSLPNRIADCIVCHQMTLINKFLKTKQCNETNQPKIPRAKPVAVVLGAAVLLLASVPVLRPVSSKVFARCLKQKPTRRGFRRETEG